MLFVILRSAIGNFKMAERLNWEDELFGDDISEEVGSDSENESDEALVGLDSFQ